MCRADFLLSFEKSRINTFFWRRLKIDFEARTESLGVSMKSCRFGVIVSSTEPNGEAKKKLRNNDLITHINDTRAIGHIKTADIIRANKLELKMIVWRPPFWWDWTPYQVTVFNASS